MTEDAGNGDYRSTLFAKHTRKEALKRIEMR